MVVPVLVTDFIFMYGKWKCQKRVLLLFKTVCKAKIRLYPVRKLKIQQCAGEWGLPSLQTLCCMICCFEFKIAISCTILWLKYGQYPGNVPPPSKPEDSIFCKTVNSYGMKVNITI